MLRFRVVLLSVLALPLLGCPASESGPAAGVADVGADGAVAQDVLPAEDLPPAEDSSVSDGRTVSGKAWFFDLGDGLAITQVEDVTGAVVSVFELPERQVSLDESGEFSLDGLPQGVPLTFALKHPDFMPMLTRTFVLGAGEDNPPMWHRFDFMDHQCAMSSALATLLALYHRDRTGEGQATAGSLLGAGVMASSETYLRPDGTLAPFDLLDPDQTGVSESRRFIECGDGWVAVASDDPGQVATIAAIESETATVDEALAALGAAGVPAARVELDQGQAFFDDTANQAAGLVADYRHAEWGRLQQPGALWYFGDDLSVQLHLAPPELGEHTAECLVEFGVNKEAVEALLNDGVAVQYQR